MTHTTEQDRADFEAVASGLCKWPKAIERDTNGDYLLMQTASGWAWWQLALQAARRAPAAPVPQGWKDGVLAVADMLKKKADVFSDAHGYEDMGSLSFGKGSLADAKLDHHSHLLELEEEVRDMLAAAHQPPEADMGIPISAATPVQMPEPAAYVHTPAFVWRQQVTPVVSFDKRDAEHKSGFYALRTPLYTEQQVRQLLAAQARVPLTIDGNDIIRLAAEVGLCVHQTDGWPDPKKIEQVRQVILRATA